MNAGFVYIIHDKLSKLHKIGYSTCVELRLKELSRSKVKLSLIHVIYTEKARDLEFILHHVFRSQGIPREIAPTASYEWFKLNEQDLQFIKSLDGNNPVQKVMKKFW